MKYYLIEPQFKKCVTDLSTWKKEFEDGTVCWLTKEELYRSGSFVVRYPETDDEILEELQDRDIDSLEDFYEFYGEDAKLEELWLPDAEEEWFEMEDYHAEMLEMWDGCATDWNLQVVRGDMTEEEKEDLLEQLENLYAEEFDCGIESDGWEHKGCHQQIHCALSINECDEHGEVDWS